MGRAGLAEGVGLGPEDPLADIAAAAAIIVTISTASDTDTSQPCNQKRKCKDATPQNIQAVLAPSTMLTLQPTVSAAAVQAYVSAIEAGAEVPPISVDENVIVDGNHRYIASLLCNIIAATRPGTRPLSLVPVPVQTLRIEP